MPLRQRRRIANAAGESDPHFTAVFILVGLAVLGTALAFVIFYRLIAEIGARPGAPYYDCWLAALERLVVERGVTSLAEVAAAQRRVRHESS